jgi:hypothetical protein
LVAWLLSPDTRTFLLLHKFFQLVQGFEATTVFCFTDTVFTALAALTVVGAGVSLKLFESIVVIEFF